VDGTGGPSGIYKNEMERSFKQHMNGTTIVIAIPFIVLFLCPVFVRPVIMYADRASPALAESEGTPVRNLSNVKILTLGVKIF
jgi:hypothetical protein